MAGAAGGAATAGVRILRPFVPNAGAERSTSIRPPLGERSALAAPTLAASRAPAGGRAASARWRAAIASIASAGWSASVRPGVGAQSGAAVEIAGVGVSAGAIFCALMASPVAPRGGHGWLAANVDCGCAGTSTTADGLLDVSTMGDGGLPSTAGLVCIRYTGATLTISSTVQTAATARLAPAMRGQQSATRYSRSAYARVLRPNPLIGRRRARVCPLGTPTAPRLENSTSWD